MCLIIVHFASFDHLKLLTAKRHDLHVNTVSLTAQDSHLIFSFIKETYSA